MEREFSICERKQCPVCGGFDLTEMYTVYDDRYGQPDLYDVLECRNPLCRLAFIRQEIAKSQLPHLYSKYYHHIRKKRSQKTDLWLDHVKHVRDILFRTENVYRHIKPRTKLLDVGCGYGPSRALLFNREIDWTGLELDHVKSEENVKKGLNCLPLSIEDYAESNPDKFDVIYANQVIEHVTNPLRFLSNVRQLLSKDGCAVFATPNYDSSYRITYGRAWIHWHVPYHQFYYCSTSIRQLAKVSGFKIIDIYSRTPFPFYIVQKNISPCPRGQKNPSYCDQIKFAHLRYFLDIRNLKKTDKYHTEDCLYVKLRPEK